MNHIEQERDEYTYTEDQIHIKDKDKALLIPQHFFSQFRNSVLSDEYQNRIRGKQTQQKTMSEEETKQIVQEQLQNELSIVQQIRFIPNLEESLIENFSYDFSEYDFNRLKIMSLCQNNIQSIEWLCYLKAQSLEILDLQKNFVVSIRPLVKACFPKIRNLNLSKSFMNKDYNCVQDFSVLQQANFPSLQILWCETSMSMKVLQPNLIGVLPKLSTKSKKFYGILMLNQQFFLSKH